MWLKTGGLVDPAIRCSIAIGTAVETIEIILKRDFQRSM
tara:strand:- start:246 stop:362 length:117 start_codon:yes stop_codon:yes gene_type:complete